MKNEIFRPKYFPFDSTSFREEREILIQRDTDIIAIKYFDGLQMNQKSF